jgi:signal transduction histidine kinase
LTWLLQVGAALGGLTFLGGLITALALWRRSKAEAKKTGADATSVLTDTALKAATTAIANIEKQAEKLGEQLVRTQDELEKTRDELHAVRHHMGVLEGLLREREIPVPKFVYPPTRNGAA